MEPADGNEHIADRPPAPGPLAGLLDRLRPDRQAFWLTLFLTLGVAARVVRYGLKFPLWEDECFLCVNLIDAGLADLLGPLRYQQVAPPLFLFAQYAAVALFGFGEWALRLGPLVCGVASLFLFRHLAGRLLSGRSLTLAVGLYAVAYPGIRYSAEAKQYAGNGLAALVLLTLAVEWRRSGRAAWLWAAAAFAPPAIGFSYPGAFVCGGVSLAVAAVLLNARAGRRSFRRCATAWVGFNVATAAAFGLLLATAAKAQADSELSFMQSYWADAFPPLSEPWRLPGWLAVTHASELFAWPVGGARGASLLTLGLVLAGLPAILRDRTRFLPVLLLGPFAVHLAAAALHRYPYGGHVKFSMHLGPAICLLAGLGGARLAAWAATFCANRPRFEPRLATAAFVCLAAVAVAATVRDVATPYKAASDERGRAFAKWFFFNAAHEGPVRVIEEDSPESFSPATWSELSWAAQLLCNRAIYTPDRHRVQPAAGDGFRCLVYRDETKPFDAHAHAAWLGRMESRHRLAGRDRFPLTRHDRRGRLIKTDWVEVYRFESPAVAAGETAGVTR